MPIDAKNAQAKEEVAKEPFDYEKFAKLYLHDRGSCQMLSGQESDFVKAQYEARYNDHPEIKTVKDFADYLDRMDATS